MQLPQEKEIYAITKKKEHKNINKERDREGWEGLGTKTSCLSSLSNCLELVLRRNNSLPCIRSSTNHASKHLDFFSQVIRCLLHLASKTLGSHQAHLRGCDVKVKSRGWIQLTSNKAEVEGACPICFWFFLSSSKFSVCFFVQNQT